MTDEIPARPRGGRPAYQPTEPQREQVKTFAAYGIPQKEIARVLKIDPKTLRKYYDDELATGSTLATAKVAESLYNHATGKGRGAVTAAIFWMKTRGGWKDTMHLEHSGPDGGPQQHRVDHGLEVDLSALSEDELMQLQTLQAKALDAARRKPGPDRD